MSHQYTTRTTIRNLDKPNPEQDRQSESLWIRKNIGGWNLTFELSRSGKITVISRKILGKIGSRGSEASLSLTLETTDNRVKEVKCIGLDTQYQPRFIEINDGKHRVVDEYKGEEKFYKRKWQNSSILTPLDLFSEALPDWEDLLLQKELGKSIHKLAEEVSKVNLEDERNYINLEKGIFR
jgi:hypothetical protein